MPSELKERFSTEDTASTEAGSTGGAVIIPMYREAATPPNMAPSIPAPYQVAPPPLTVPYGWRLVKTPAGWMLQHEPAEWNVIARCVEGRRSGRPYDAIAAELAAEEAPVWNERARDYGPPRWHRERVRRLVRRYAPEMEIRGRGGYRPRGGTRHAAELDEQQLFERMLVAAELEELEDATP